MKLWLLCISISISISLSLLHFALAQDAPAKDLELVNVRDFGAQGDGCTDDTQAFQSVLNLVQDGLVVWIPSGTYMVSSLKITGNQTRIISLIGEDQYATVIRMHNSSCSLAGECIMLWAFDKSFLVISTITWDGNNLASSVFRHDGPASAGTLSNLIFRNSNYAIRSTSSKSNCTEWKFFNCEFETVTTCFSGEDLSSSNEEPFVSQWRIIVVTILVSVLALGLYTRPKYFNTRFAFGGPTFKVFSPKVEEHENQIDFDYTKYTISEAPTKPKRTNKLTNAIFSYSFASGYLPVGVSAYGGQAGTSFNIRGFVVPTNSPRIDFGNTYLPYGEPARANLVLQANSFSTSPWLPKTAGPNAVVQLTENAATAPDGSLNACKLVSSASGSNGNAQAQVQQIVSGIVIGQVYTASVYVQGTVGGETLLLQIQTGGSPYTTLAYSGIIATTSWNRYSCTFLATSSSLYFSIGTDTTVAPFSGTVLAGGTVNIYGSQLEAGPDASSFIPTATAPMSRVKSLQRVFAPLSGLLVEPSRTNLVPSSNLFNLSPWQLVNDGATVTVTPNAGTSPSGQPCVQATFSPLSSTFQMAAVQQLINGFTVGSTYQASVWVKGLNGGETLYLSVQLGEGPDTVLGYVLISAQTYWQRFTCSFVSSGTSIYFGIGGNTTVAPMLPTYGGSVLLFNAQVEQGSWPSSDIITLSSPVTRAADSIFFSIPPTVDTLNYTFSDGTVQSISVSPGSYTIPTNLNRGKITLITGSSTPSVPIANLNFSSAYKYNNNYPFKVMNGDTWSTTWADDDVIYTQSCDSFNVWAPSTATSNFCISSLSDTTTSLTGSPVNSMTIFGHTTQIGPDGATWKANGTICVNGVLYTWISRQVYGNSGSGYIQTASGGQLIKSSDHGVTWTPLPPGQALPFTSPMFPTAAFSAPEFIQFGGRDYQNNVVHNADQYVYAISNDGSWNNGNYIFLGRVPIGVIGNLNASDWQFYQGGDGTLSSNWGSVSTAYHIISGAKQCGIAGAQYLPFCKRYLLLQWYYPSIPNNDTNNVTDSLWQVYESPTPWGPWTLIQVYEWKTEPGLGLYNPNVMPKSLSFDNGQNIVVTTCGDYWNSSISNGDYTLTLVTIQVNIESS